MRMIKENMAKQLEWCHEAPFYTLGPLTTAREFHDETPPPGRRQNRPSRPAGLHVRPAFCSMKITEDVREYAAEQGLAEEEALKAEMAEKSKEFVEAGAEVYSPA